MSEIRSAQLAPEGAVAVEMLRRVLDAPVAPVVVPHGVDGLGGEAPPAEGHYQWVVCLEDLLVPTVLLQPSLHHTQCSG